jgi:transcriptional regulator with PAS, ATPase and Fis domain
MIKHFLKVYNQNYNTGKNLSIDALNAMLNYDWPGNVRERAHLVRGVSAKKNQGTMIAASDIPPEIVYRQLRKKEPHEQES